MESLQTVIKVEDNSHYPHNIRRIFSVCGEILSLHLSPTASSKCAHYFIQFRNIQGAERALKLKLDIPNITVFPVHSTPLYVDQYSNANPDAFSASRNSSPSNESRSSSKRKNASLLPVVTTVRPPIPTAPRSFAVVMEAVAQTESPTLNSKSSIGHSEPVDAHTFAPTPPSPVKSLPVIVTSCDNLLPNTVPSYPLETSVAMHICGEAVVYNLKHADPDPNTIIELLKVTNSERGSWMVVAAYYRRAGMTEAAITIANALLGVLRQTLVSPDLLKPMYLFLSGCEADLARQTRLDNHPKSSPSVHYQNAQKWLQLVYGECNESLTQNTSSFSPLLTLDAQSSNACKQPTPSVFSHPANDGTKHHAQALAKLRKEQDKALSQLQTSKRKLEEDNIRERNVRRKLERELQVMQKERDAALMLEKHALDLVKKEVAARRHAQEEAENERNLNREILRLAKRRVEPPPEKILFEDLANCGPKLMR